MTYVGFMDRFKGRLDAATTKGGVGLPAGKFVALPEDHFMRVVGESHCQDALRALPPECVPGADKRPSFVAALVPEPENPFDRHAIAVHGPTGRVGYLPS